MTIMILDNVSIVVCVSPGSNCDVWFCFDCHDFPTKDALPDEFFLLEMCIRSVFSS